MSHPDMGGWNGALAPATLLLVALALVAWPAAASAQPATTHFFGPRGQYEGRAVESKDGNQVLLFAPRGYAGRLQKGAAGTWLRFGSNGDYEGRAVPGADPFRPPSGASKP